MKKLVCMLALVLVSTLAFGQKEVTKFLGIPVDGTKAEMKQKLIAKGFELNRDKDGDEFFTGEFNGKDVIIYVQTNNNKVWRISIMDKNNYSEGQIKIHYNNLLRQFKQNKKYFTGVSADPLPDDEDISYEMTVHNKQYHAIFYQRDLQAEQKLMDDYINNVGGREELEKLPPSEQKEIMDFAQKTIELALIGDMFNRTVWFTINQYYGKYSLCIYYENEYNKANGDDL